MLPSGGLGGSSFLVASKHRRVPSSVVSCSCTFFCWGILEEYVFGGGHFVFLKVQIIICCTYLPVYSNLVCIYIYTYIISPTYLANKVKV